MKKFSALMVCFGILSGCSHMQTWLGEAEMENPSLPEAQAPRYSETPQMAVPSTRKYQRMTRSRMEEESELHSQAGSMWISEGQTSYLFVQNKTRREGDILNVRLDGSALKQVETKVSVIKKLLQQLEDQQKAELEMRMAGNMSNNAERGPASEGNKEPEKKTVAEKPAAEEKQDLSDVEVITTRITEKLGDGNYRIRGAQPFMIGKREYKVIVTGIVRPEDYDDQGLSSSKLLDPQFDVVSVRRKQGNESNASTNL